MSNDSQLMNDDPYSNRELDHFFTDLRSKFLSTINTIKESTERIEAQTIKTNGRVTELEKQQITRDAKVNLLVTMVKVVIVSMLCPLIVGAIIVIFGHWFKNGV